MNLTSEIAAWDKKSVDFITGVYQRYAAEPDFVGHIVSLTPDQTLQSGSTWLLKHYLEHHQKPIAAAWASAIFEQLDALVEWEAKLHILQSMAYLPVPEKCRETTKLFVLENINSEIKFIRAWAYSGYFQLAIQYPDLRPDAERLLKDALQNDPAASVKARIRQLFRKGF